MVSHPPVVSPERLSPRGALSSAAVRAKPGQPPAKTPPPARGQPPLPTHAVFPSPAPGAAREPQSVVLVGVGVGARHWYFAALNALQLAGTLIVRAIVDPAGTVGDEAREAFPKAIHATSFDSLPHLPDALAIIATPIRQHMAQTNVALKRGWHVLCSTPLAANAGDAATMIAAAQRHDRLLAVDFRTRFFPACRYLRTLCEDHLLGPPLSFRVHVGQTSPGAGGNVGTDKLLRPDGALTLLGSPCLELLTWCFGDAAIVNYADDAMGGVEANAVIDLAFRDGLRGTVHLSRDWPVEDSYTVVFERGIARWNGSRVNGLTLQLASAPMALAGELAAPLSAVHPQAALPPITTETEASVALLEHLVAAIRGRETLRVPATEVMHSLPLIDACYAQRSPLPQPWLSRNDAAHARALSPPAALRRP